MCRKTCSTDCRSSNNKCHPITGECLTENSQIIFDLSGISNNNNNNITSSNNIMKLSSERIKAKHWIQVNGNGKLNFKNCTTFDNNNDEKCTKNDIEKNDESKNSTTNDNIVNLIGKTHQHNVLIHKNNTLMINALNSSIANLTNDVDKLTKQVSDQQTEIKRVITNDVILPNFIPKIGIFLDAPSPTAAVIAQISQPPQQSDNSLQPIVVAAAAAINDNNVVKQTMNSILSSNNNMPTILLPSLSLNQQQQHADDKEESYHYHHLHRRNNHSYEKQQRQQQHQQEQMKLSIIETNDETIQQKMDQNDSNRNDNENENDDNDDGVTELNNNENEIFHVFENVVVNDNNTVGDTVSNIFLIYNIMVMVCVLYFCCVIQFFVGFSIFLYMCELKR